MKVLICSSEIVPFSKTGGLADVVGALPQHLMDLDIEIVLFMPKYRCVMDGEFEFEDIDLQVNVPIANNLVTGRISRTRLPNTPITVYAVEHADYFDRPQLYGEGGQDYGDNCERFVFFCRSVLEAIRILDWKPDLIHCNDWQTGLIPALIRNEMSSCPFYENVVTLLTIHNLAYQGSFWHWDMLLTGLGWEHFNWKEMEFFGRLNLLKTGIVFADAINTVSPTYAAEIQTVEHGCGLDSVLRFRGNVLSGILNGIDGNEWNPAIDQHLVVNYDVQSWQRGKSACKMSMQNQRGLPVKEDIPLIGMVGRLASQKGWSLILPMMENWLQSQQQVQWLILGTGQPEYEELLEELADRFPDRVSVELAFSNSLAHQIEAAADIFLMPSEYEPCGLNQQYSLAYGTVPVVRETGGLADTVIDATEDSIRSGIANGFSFNSFDLNSLNFAMERAVGMYRSYPDIWKQLVETGMRNDWSWKSSAQKYARLYQSTVDLARAV